MAGVSGAESLDPVLVDGLRRLKLARIRRLAPEVCATARGPSTVAPRGVPAGAR